MKYAVPFVICAVLALALFRKKPSYDLFIEGARDGLSMLKSIFPPMLAIMTAVSMLRASGAFDMLTGAISSVTDKIGFPGELVPLALVRPLSGSGALGVFTDILHRYGADSEIGRCASVICGSTETTFYCLCVYFSRTRVKNTAKAVPFAIFGDLVCFIAAVWVSARF